jgi:hypothetical protein
MLARRFYTPSQAQDAIQDINRTLQGFYRNPSESSVARSAILAPVADTLRSGLDQAIAASPVGPGYAALKAQYGALRSAEKDVTAAAQRESNKIPGGVGGIATDVMASERVIHGIIHMDPTAIATATGLKAAKEWMRRANSPNAAISRIFSSRTQPPAGPVASGLRRALPIEGGLAGSDVANDRPLRPSIAGP